MKTMFGLGRYRDSRALAVSQNTANNANFTGVLSLPMNGKAAEGRRTPKPGGNRIVAGNGETVPECAGPPALLRLFVCLIPNVVSIVSPLTSAAADFYVENSIPESLVRTDCYGVPHRSCSAGRGRPATASNP